MNSGTLLRKTPEYQDLLHRSGGGIPANFSHLNVGRTKPFGSYITGRGDLLADSDVLVVMATNRPRPGQIAEGRGLLAWPVAAHTESE